MERLEYPTGAVSESYYPDRTIPEFPRTDEERAIDRMLDTPDRQRDRALWHCIREAVLALPRGREYIDDLRNASCFGEAPVIIFPWSEKAAGVYVGNADGWRQCTATAYADVVREWEALAPDVPRPLGFDEMRPTRLKNPRELRFEPDPAENFAMPTLWGAAWRTWVPVAYAWRYGEDILVVPCLSPRVMSDLPADMISERMVAWAEPIENTLIRWQRIAQHQPKEAPDG